MDNSLIQFDPTGKSYGHFFKIKKLLYEDHSHFQKILVFDTEDIGRVLMLDGAFNLSTLMDPFYHEPMAHIPIAMLDNKNDLNILIIGGGDYGVANQVLKHQNVREVILCEIDEKVVEAARIFFPELSCCERDPRLKLVIEDGFKFLENSRENAFDLIIIDSTDPFSTASSLVSPDFYTLAYRSLKPKGLLMQLMADTIFYKETWLTAVPNVKKIFDKFIPLFVPIPFYVTGTWGLMLTGKKIDKFNVSRVNNIFLSKIKNLKTINEELVRGWFSLAPHNKEFFDSLP